MIDSVEKVIDALGGTAATARVVGMGMAGVCGWRERGRIPARHYLRITTALKALRRGAVDPGIFFDTEDA